MIKLPVHRQWFGLSEPERQGTDWISFIVSGIARDRLAQTGQDATFIAAGPGHNLLRTQPGKNRH